MVNLDSYTIKGTNIIIRLDDCVLIKPPAPVRFPYVARVEGLIVDSQNEVRVFVRWYYRPQDTKQGRTRYHGLRELFSSNHGEWQNARTIYSKCKVHSINDYARLDKVGPQDYFSRFEYNAFDKKFADDYNIPVHCKCQMPYNPDQFMVLCDGCDDWFHPSCLKKTNEEAEAMDEFFCSDCLPI